MRAFPLASADTEAGTFYAIQDWIRGLTGADNIRRIWRDMQRGGSLSQLYDSIVQLPYIATNDKTYQADFINDKGLYLIAQNLRSTKARPALAAIKKYLAEAGAFVDEVRRDPNIVLLSGAMTPDQAMEAAIQAYRAQGKDDRWIALRLEGKIKRNLFTAALQAAVAETLKRWHYATATDDVYKGLWGRTAANLKKELAVPKGESLRDHQPTLGLYYQGIAEEAAAYKLGDRQEVTWGEAREIVMMVAGFVGTQAQAMSELLQMDLATGKRLLSATS
ncbi:MAG: hypothetical protein H7Y09_04760 [Chitinophagaceae bacterium]|nr:hypothetical protein [Anaerolineae bacterium]